jgi:hypothetical protein
MSQTSRTIYSLFQLIYLTDLIFNSSSAHLVHEPSSRIKYRIELQTILELAQVIANPREKKYP